MEDIKTNNIYDYVKIAEIRKLLIHYPLLCILFEILCLHINTLLEIKKDNKNDERLVKTIS